MPSVRVATNAQFRFPNGLISQGLSTSELKSLQKLALSRKFFSPCGFDIFRKSFCLETTSFANRLSNLSTPPFDHLSVICQHLADTYPDQTNLTRVSFSTTRKKRDNLGTRLAPLPLYNAVFVKCKPSALEAFLQNKDPNLNKNLATFYLNGYASKS